MSEENEDLQKKRQHLKSLIAFIESPAYLGYVSAVRVDIQANKDAQVAITPDNLPDIVELLQLKGELRCLESRLTMFEDARTKLERRIDEMVEAELESATETKK
jgi:hypothetical protein